MEQRLEELLTAYQQGRAEAVDELVDTLSPLLRRFFLSLDFDREEADDMVQETWLRLHKARQTYRPGAPALPWIYAIARHARLDSLRRRSRLRRHEVAVAVLPELAVELPGVPPVDAPELLRGLPEAQREALVMTKVNRMSLEEVARATGSSVGAVKQRVFRAYEKLRTSGRAQGRQ